MFVYAAWSENDMQEMKFQLMVSALVQFYQVVGLATACTPIHKIYMTKV